MAAIRDLKARVAVVMGGIMALRILAVCWIILCLVLLYGNWFLGFLD